MRRSALFITFVCLITLLTPRSGFAQAQTPFLGMGDSLGEGVQSDNASIVSQPHDYLTLIAYQMGVAFPEPLIVSGPRGTVGSTSGRGRLHPTTVPADLAVSGATTEDVIASVATVGGSAEIDLVLPPYIGLSQLQIAEQVRPKTIFCWIGANDLIGYITSFNHLNNPTFTPVSVFAAEYKTLVAGLKSTGAQVVLGNIPDLTETAYVLDNAQLQRYGGSQYSLQSGYFTTLPTAFLLHLGVFSQKQLNDPAYVLSPAQIANIKKQVDIYNAVIAETAKAAGFPVADIHAFQQSIVTNPITIQGVTITTGFNGGAFSLDGIHPSDFGYALFANAFIDTYNAAYLQSVPKLSDAELVGILDKDPFIDWNGNGVVPGRPGTGMLESEGPLLGISGDKNDKPPSSSPATSPQLQSAVTGNASAFMQLYFASKGMNPQTAWTPEDVENVFVDLFHAK